MKIPILLLFGIILHVGVSNVHSQTTINALNLKDATVEEVLSSIEENSNFYFLYNSKLINVDRKISINTNGQSIETILESIFKQTDVVYKIEGYQIILSKKEVDSPSVQRGSQAERKIVGVVRDKNGEAFIGASVFIKGTTIGVVTDKEGRFSLMSPNNVKSFYVSFIGMKPQEVIIDNKSVYNIVLEDEVMSMDEVVVTALGIKRELKALAYNVQLIDGNELSKSKSVNIMNSLAGKVAGATINSSAAGIGGGARIVMRGTKSISGNNNALYVVDGIPLPNPTTTQPDDQYTGAGQTGDGLSSINPEDIESISILNGSAAAALYGSAAANGVVIITTKKGQTGTTKLSYSNNSTFYSPFKIPKFQNKYGSETGEWYSWASEMSTPSSYSVRDFFQTGYHVSNTVSLTTGTEKNQTYASFGSSDARGVIDNNNLNSYNFSVKNTTLMLNDKLTMDLSFMYSKIKERNMLSQGQYANPLVPIYLFPRGDDIQKYQYFERYDVDRNIKTQFWPLGDNGLSMQNPYWITARNLYINNKDRYLIGGSLNYKVWDWLNVSGRVKIDKEQASSDRKMYASTLTVLAENSEKGAYIATSRNTTQSYADLMLNINKYFGVEKWNVTATLGVSILDLKHKELTFGGGLLTIPNLFTAANVNTAGKLTYKNNDFRERTNSVFGTASLGYKGMAYLDISLRNDWLSALYGTNHSSILYPSVGLSGIVTDILRIKSNVLSYAKVRVSYSEVGNAPERFRAITTYSVTGGLNTTSYFPIKDLAPERTHSWEAGFNFAFLKNKLTMDVTAYKSYTENQLFSPDISTTTGYSKLYVNAGKVTNKGLELALGYNQNIGPVKWNTSFIWFINRNKINQLLPEYTNKDLGVTVHLDEMDVYLLGGAKQRLTVGGSMGDLYVNTMRTDEHGQIWINSMTGALETDKNNYVYAGNTNPKYNMSWRNQFDWKGFNLSFLVTARIGGVGVSATQAVLDYYGVSQTTAKSRDNGGVAINGQRLDAQTWYQTIGANGVDYIGSMYVYSMTNVRLGELAVGYNVPIKKWCPWIETLGISLVGQNLIMLYSKAPFDPESTASTGTYNQGMDYFMQPSLRSLGFSAKVTF